MVEEDELPLLHRIRVKYRCHFFKVRVLVLVLCLASTIGHDSSLALLERQLDLLL